MGEILFLTHRVPWPPDRGDKIRAHHMLRHLLDIAPVHLACFAESEAEAELSDPVRDRLASCKIVRRSKPQWQAGLEALATGQPISLTAFASRALDSHVARLIASGRIDRIVAFSGQMAHFVPTDFTGRFVMDFVDVDSAKFDGYAAQSDGPMAWVHAREGRRLAQFERQVAERADAASFVSEAEAALFRDRSGLNATRVIAIENGIDCNSYDPAKVDPVAKPTDGPLIVFTGQMDYRPNVEAVTSFAEIAMPVIRHAHPDAIFAIVGRAPVPAVLALNERDDVLVTGTVPDVRGWLAAADLVVAPLRIARGIQNKVLEAMAMARPVLASAAAAEGIDADDGEHFRIAPDVASEAELALGMLADPAASAAMGQAARAHMLARYGWGARLAPLANLLSADGKRIAA